MHSVFLQWSAGSSAETKEKTILEGLHFFSQGLKIWSGIFYRSACLVSGTLGHWERETVLRDKFRKT